MKVSDAVFDFFIKRGVTQGFAVTGGAAAHLFDSLSRTSINTVHMHHEQACAMAADGYARVSGKPALVIVTNGPGVSNTVTGVLGAFQDSIPMIVISGQVPTHQMLKNSGGVTRQFGVQEIDTKSLVSSIVKYFVSLESEKDLQRELNKAWRLAISGRPGPVWIEIPLNVQSKVVNPINFENIDLDLQDIFHKEFIQALSRAKHPIIIIGGGIHTSKTKELVVNLSKKLRLPVVSTWGANDVFTADDEIYFGNFGILGNRVPNIAIQNADFLLILGSRMSIPNTGYQTELFSPNSYKIMVNIDSDEMHKLSIKIDLPIQQDLNQWLSALPIDELAPKPEWEAWLIKLKHLNTFLSIEREPLVDERGRVDSYSVIEKLSSLIPSGATLVTDMGTSFTCTMQAFRNFKDVRLFTSSGTSSMGFGLPGAIGAYFADQSKPIYLIAGDGGFQMNLQELQTVRFHDIPIKMILLNSNGYLAVSIMQQNSFNGQFVGSNPQSGLDAPNFTKVVKSFGLNARKVRNSRMLARELRRISINKSAELLEVNLPKDQLMRPRSQSLRDSNGNFFSQSIDMMWPYLSSTEIDQIDALLEKPFTT
jgi:acetolactate synthase-1/2/3 large subunit